MKWYVICHKIKTIKAYSRKQDAIYEHVKYKRGEKVQFKEATSIQVPQGYKLLSY